MGVRYGIRCNLFWRRFVNTVHVGNWVGNIIVDAGVAIGWPDNWQLIEIGLWGGGHGEEKTG